MKIYNHDDKDDWDSWDDFFGDGDGYGDANVWIIAYVICFFAVSVTFYMTYFLIMMG
jgi:hypothetical protein